MLNDLLLAISYIAIAEYIFKIFGVIFSPKNTKDEEEEEFFDYSEESKPVKIRKIKNTTDPRDIKMLF